MPSHRASTITPLGIIAAFVALSETVGGFAATLTGGAIQMAFTAFAVGFPVLVCAAFFAVLWRRSYVLYPPQDFGAHVDVKQYVDAMRHQAIGNQEVVGLIRSSIESAIVSPEGRVLLSQVAGSAELNSSTLAGATDVLAARAVGHLREAVVTIDIKEVSRSEESPDLVFRFDPHQRAFAFLSAIFYQISDRIPPFAYGRVWALRDTGTDKLLLPDSVDWSDIRALASSKATVSELGLVAGMRLRAVELRSSFRDHAAQLKP